jgi:hypothetical protein
MPIPLSPPTPLQRLAQVLQAVDFETVSIPATAEQPFEQLLVSLEAAGPLGDHPFVLLFQDDAARAMARQAGVSLDPDPAHLLQFQTQLPLDVPEGDKTWLFLAMNLINQWLPIGQLNFNEQDQVHLRYTLLTTLGKKYELVVIELLGDLALLAHRCWNWLESAGRGELDYATLAADILGPSGDQAA